MTSSGAPSAAGSWFPTTQGQDDLLILHQQWADTGAPISTVLELDGPLDVTALVSSLQRTVRSTACLGVVVREAARGGFEQSCLPTLDVSAELLSIEGADDLWTDRFIRKLLNSDVTSWSVWREPPFRFRLLRRGAHRHLLLVSVQHVVADAFTLASIEASIFREYGSVLRGEAGELDPDDRAYRGAVLRTVPSDRAEQRDRDWWSRSPALQVAPSVPLRDAVLAKSEARLPTDAWERFEDRARAEGGSATGAIALGLVRWASDALDVGTVDLQIGQRTRVGALVPGMFAVARPVRVDAQWGVDRAAQSVMATMAHHRVNSRWLRDQEPSTGRDRNAPELNVIRHPEREQEPAGHPYELRVTRRPFTVRRTRSVPCRMRVDVGSKYAKFAMQEHPSVVERTGSLRRSLEVLIGEDLEWR